jgi:hypothetical protein
MLDVDKIVDAVSRTIRGEDPKMVASDLGVTSETLIQWRDSFLAGGKFALQRKTTGVGQAPKLFISHKHSDARIAKVLAEWVRQKSNAGVSIHLSSDPEFEGPRTGKSLNEQLIRALWLTDAFILVYTSIDEDWSYCMWECGLATHPNSPETSIRVLQCGDDVPAPFADKVRIKVSRFADIKRFAIEFFQHRDFFPDRPALAPNLKESDIDMYARQLHEELVALSPKEPTLEWATWPYLRLELPVERLEAIRSAEETKRKALAFELVGDAGAITDASPGAFSVLFDAVNVEPRYAVATLLARWKDGHPDQGVGWFESCCEQVVSGWLQRPPLIRLEAVRRNDGNEAYVPVLSRVMKVPVQRVANFDFYFYALSDPRAVLATSRMIPKEHLYAIRIGRTEPGAFRLRDLLDELGNKRLNRLPVLDDGDRPLYVIHRSMIERFLTQKLLGRHQGLDLDALSLGDFLGDEAMKQFVERTFVVLPKNATLEEARQAMNSVSDCRDSFITLRGGRDEPIQGWLTNVAMA